MSRQNTRGHQPYDLNNPANWTVKLEIEKLGIKITPAISKSALLQIYNQLISKNVVNIPQNTVSDTELNTVEEAPTEREHEVTMVNSVPSGNTDSGDHFQLFHLFFISKNFWGIQFIFHKFILIIPEFQAVSLLFICPFRLVAQLP